MGASPEYSFDSSDMHESSPPAIEIEVSNFLATSGLQETLDCDRLPGRYSAIVTMQKRDQLPFRTSELEVRINDFHVLARFSAPDSEHSFWRGTCLSEGAARVQEASQVSNDRSKDGGQMTANDLFNELYPNFCTGCKTLASFSSD